MALTLYEEMQNILKKSGAKDFVSDAPNKDKYAKKIEEFRKTNIVLEECIQDKTDFFMEVHRAYDSRFSRERLAMLEQCVGDIPNAYGSTFATVEYGIIGTGIGALFGLTYGYFATTDKKEFPKITRRNFLTGFMLGGMATLGPVGSYWGYVKSTKISGDYDKIARDLDSIITSIYHRGDKP